MAFNSLSKIRGQAKSSAYPQPEGTLGETMVKYGKDLGEDRFGKNIFVFSYFYKYTTFGV